MSSNHPIDDQLLGEFETRIAGMQYYDASVALGEEVNLEREPENPHDRWSIRVENGFFEPVGHLPRRVVSWLAPLIDSGQVRVDGYAKDRTKAAESVGNRVEIRWILGAPDPTRSGVASVCRKIQIQSDFATDTFYSVAFSPDGCRAISGHAKLDLATRTWIEDYCVTILWDVKTGRQVRRFRGHTSPVRSVAFSPDGGYLVSGSGGGHYGGKGYIKGNDHTVRVWDVETGSELCQFDPGQRVTSVAFLPDGRHVVSGGGAYDRNQADLLLWKLPEDLVVGEARAAAKPAAESELHATSTTPQQVEPDPAAQIRKLIPEASAMARQDLEKLASSPTAPKASNIVEKSLTLILLALEPKDDDPAKEQFQFLEKGISHLPQIVEEICRGLESPEGAKPGGPVTFIHADRITDFTCEADGDTASGAVSFEMPELCQGKVNYVARRRDGSWHIEEFTMPAYDVQIVRDGKGMWIEKQSAITEVRQFEGHTRFIRGLAFFSDGQRAISASFDATLRVWNVDTGQELRRIDTGGSGSIALSPDDKLVAVGNEGGEGFNLWDLESGEKVRSFQGHSARGHIGFSADGRRILSSSFDDFTARLWDVDTREQLCQFQVGKNPDSITFSADGQFAVGGDADQNTRIWDAETGQTVAILENNDAHATLRTTFSPDGCQVLTGSATGVLRLWDLLTREEIRRFNGHERPVIDVAFTADGRHIVSASVGKSLRLWETASGRELPRIHAETRRFNHLAVSPDGRCIIAGGGAGWINSKGRMISDGDFAVHLYRLPEYVWPKVEPGEEPDEASATSENIDAKPAAKPDTEPEAVPEPAGPPETAPSPEADGPQLEEEAEKTPPGENPDSHPGASDSTAKSGEETERPIEKED